MLVSFNELEARLKKAARGSGLPWGVAEEYAKSVLWLAHAGFELQGWAVDELETSGIEQSLLDWAYALDLTEAPQQSSSTPLTASQTMLWLGFVGTTQRLRESSYISVGLRYIPQALVALNSR